VWGALQLKGPRLEAEVSFLIYPFYLFIYISSCRYACGSVESSGYVIEEPMNWEAARKV
jgi:hypothetical protein